MPHSLQPHGLQPTDSSAHGISQTRTLEWITISISMGSSLPRDQTHIFCIGIWVLDTEPPKKPHLLNMDIEYQFQRADVKTK